jgi:hypothetical protein
MQNIEQIVSQIKRVTDAGLFDNRINLTVAERAQLIQGGFEPILVAGKAPVTEDWQSGAITSDRIGAKCALYPHAESTGLRTGRLVGIDFDVVNEKHVEELAELAERMLAETPLRRFGSKGIMLCYRNETPIRKITIAAKSAKIEILGSGQQFVAFGIHPDTNAPYRWLGETDFDEVATPLIVPLDVLPAVTPDQLRDFARQASALLADLGYEPKPPTGDMGEREAAAIGAGLPVNEKVLRSALSYLDPDAERDEWRNVVAGIRAALLVEDEQGDEAQRIALEWSRGELDRLGRYTVSPPSRYTGDDDVLAVFESMTPKPGGITVGTIFDEAMEAGWKGNPFSDGKSVPEVFGEAIARPAPDADGYTNSGGLSFRSMQDITPVEIDWLWPERIAAGKLTLIAGAPDGGKSQIAANIAATISNGGAWPFGEGKAEQGAVIWLSAEDDTADTTVPRLIAAGANRRLIFELKPIVRGETGTRTLNVVEDLGEIARVIEKIKETYGVPVRAIVIDPISAYMGGRAQGDSWKNSDVRHTMTPLLEFVARVGISTLGITHFKKGRDADVLNRVIDSIALPALSRATWLVAPEKDEEGNPTGRRLFLVGKKNIGRPVSGLAYKIVEKLIDNNRGGTMPAPCVEWAGVVVATADDALAEQTGNKAGKLEAAEDFLQLILADGPVSEREIRKRAGEKHRWRTLQRAKEKLGIVSKKIDFDREWCWQLPGCGAPEDPDHELLGIARATNRRENRTH